MTAAAVAVEVAVAVAAAAVVVLAVAAVACSCTGTDSGCGGSNKCSDSRGKVYCCYCCAAISCRTNDATGTTNKGNVLQLRVSVVVGRSENKTTPLHSSACDDENVCRP
jgi:hypothetical protein